MTHRWSMVPILLGTFAGCLVPATVLALVLGFGVLVPSPEIPDTLDLPGRLLALFPFRAAIWPIDAVSTLLFVVGFGALALASGPIAALAGHDPRAGVLRTSILASGFLGVVAGLLYLGGTQVTIALPYCDCGFMVQETISQFWAITVVQGATSWLSYGSIVFGAIGVGLGGIVLGGLGMPQSWRWIAWSAAILLVLSVFVHELSNTPAGDLIAAIASGVLLPAWALMLARRFGQLAQVHR